jgi:hypothetical protein
LKRANSGVVAARPLRALSHGYVPPSCGHHASHAAHDADVPLVPMVALAACGRNPGKCLVYSLASYGEAEEQAEIAAPSLSRRIPYTNAVPDLRVSALQYARRTFRPVGSSFHRRLRRLGI